jgi:flagellar motor switch protein FliN/FliY
MATKKTPKRIEDSLDLVGNEAELDQAIDGLRGVLKQDAGVDLSDFGAGMPDFGSDLGNGDFGGVGAADGTGLSTFSDFGGASASSDFGGGDFGGSDFSCGNDAAFGAAAAPGSALTSNLDLIKDIPIDIQIVLGSSRMQVSGLMGLTEGAIIALDKKIGEPVELTVNGRRIARGEITVLDNDDTRFGVKLIEVLKPTKA